MKKRVFELKSLLFCLILLSTVSFSLSAQNARKEISEIYDVKKGFTFNVDSKYSDIEFLTWDKDVLDVLVVIDVDAGNREKSEDYLKKIDVEISKTANSVSFETEFDFSGSPGKNVNMDIKYTVKLPAYLNVTVENSYGNVYIQELSGFVSLDIQYGNLKVNKLIRGNDKPYNNLEIAYGNAECEEIGWLELEVSYSDFNATKSDMLFVESQYSKINGDRAGTIITEGKYDKYIFDGVDNFVAELKYSNIKFGRLNKKFDLDASYTNVKIDLLPKGFEKIRSDLSYGNFSMETEPGAAFNLNAETRYGGIDVSPDSNLSRSKENGELRVWGTVGSGARADVELVTRYGNINIR